VYSEIQAIFNNYCTGCHGSSGGLTLTSGNSYNSIISNGVIVSGDHENSTLWDYVNSGYMPKNTSNNLTTEEVDLIATWIDQGANSIELFSQWIID
jgi:mono/diheme cytochrome c family protein